MVIQIIVTIGLFVTAGILWRVVWQLKRDKKLIQEKNRMEKLAPKDDVNSLKAGMEGFKTDMGRLDARIAVIEVNFEHLTDILTELTGILMDKNVLNNHDKTRLDNKLRGM